LQPVKVGALPYYAVNHNAVSVSRLLYNVNNIKCTVGTWQEQLAGTSVKEAHESLFKKCTVVCCAARLFVQLVDLFQFYMMFPIDDHTGDPVSDEDVTAAHYEKVQQVT